MVGGGGDSSSPGAGVEGRESEWVGWTCDGSEAGIMSSPFVQFNDLPLSHLNTINMAIGT